MKCGKCEMKWKDDDTVCLINDEKRSANYLRRSVNIIQQCRGVDVISLYRSQKGGKEENARNNRETVNKNNVSHTLEC